METQNQVETDASKENLKNPNFLKIFGLQSLIKKTDDKIDEDTDRANTTSDRKEGGQICSLLSSVLQK